MACMIEDDYHFYGGPMGPIAMEHKISLEILNHLKVSNSLSYTCDSPSMILSD